MDNFVQTHNKDWFYARLKRHTHELFRLALPTSLSRIGMITLGIADTAFVGHYATEHLAWLNLANQSVIMFSLVVGIGMVLGVMVMTADAYGKEDWAGCGRVWRRSLLFAFIVSLAMVLIAWPAKFWLSFLGQTADDVTHATKLIHILALGLPAHILFFTSNMFLEGVKRPGIGFVLMILANLVNLFFDYVLVFGVYGFPEMGAEGSAWTSTIVRWFMALALMGYIWFAPSLKRYEVRKPHGQKWHMWKKQRMIGYSSAVSMAVEAAAFAGLVIFAGWLGTIPLAAYGIVFQLIALPFMMAMGIGMASSVRVGITFSRLDRADTMLGGWTGIVMTMILLLTLGGLMVLFAGGAMALFTDDPEVMAVLIPVVTTVILMMFFDGTQGVVSNILRGLQETWMPTVIQTISYIGIMIPLCYYLAISMDRGLQGLMEGAAIASIFSASVLSARFWWITRAKSKLFNPNS